MRLPIKPNDSELTDKVLIHMRRFDKKNIAGWSSRGGVAALALLAALGAGCDGGNNNRKNDTVEPPTETPDTPDETVDTTTVPGTATLPDTLLGNYASAAQRYFAREMPQAPWWCRGSNGNPDLGEEECLDFSGKIDNAEYEARQYPTVDDIVAAGGRLVEDRPAGIGLAYTLGDTPTTFAEYNPNVYLYGGEGNGHRLVGVAWDVDTGTEPVGFAGDRENWVNDQAGHWWLMAWIIRGHQNQPDVFATSQPCLTDTDTILASTADACYQAAYPQPFQVMVSNDDGYMAPGIDALVEGLYTLPNAEISVVAPLANQSGSSDKTTPEPYVVDAVPGTTLSGRPATAITSTDPEDNAGSGSPADSVLYGLNQLHMAPDVVLSGSNEGQNIANLGSGGSGTIGAARTARRQGFPAIATSAGALTTEPDFATAVTYTLELLERWRLGLEADTLQTVLNINSPSCGEGESVNGLVYTVVAPSLDGRSYAAVDCNSTVPAADLMDDVDAFNNGYVSITDMGIDQPPNFE